MRRHFSRALIILFYLTVISLLNTSYIYAVTLQGEAASYREKGYEAQERGDIDSAISWYQKSIALDEDYAAPHNDLGILFEAKGWLDRAESEYKKALTINPDYEKSHTNLALLYERKGELEKAAYYWMKRYKLGRSNDAWTSEARQRLEKLGLLDAKKIQEIERSFEQQAPEEKPEQQKKKDSGEWTRIERKSEEKVVKSTPKPEPRLKPSKKTVKKITNPPAEEKTKPEKKIVKKRVKRPFDKLKVAPSEIEGKKVRKKEKKAKKKKAPSDEWTRLGGTPGEGMKRSDIDAELQESLRLAEERLREEKRKAPVASASKKITDLSNANDVKKARPASSASGSYTKAK
ncbi:MAG: tetratricopeptide repeat protein, partial [Candidatus Omnitrophica bacterium]|nr:tetratricopeptide repeat protein [Candidatus Omnitrophota bacterium]